MIHNVCFVCAYSKELVLVGREAKSFVVQIGTVCVYVCTCVLHTCVWGGGGRGEGCV